MSPRVFTIPPSAPFLPTLARAIFDGRLIDGFGVSADPLKLADLTLYLPTRRAAREFGVAMLDMLGRDAAILPRIVPLGDVDEDELAFSESAGALTAPAISRAERRLVLARLVLKFAAALPDGEGDREPLTVGSPAAALSLADELARLFDDFTIGKLSFDALDGLVPDHLDEYWRQSIEFLKIARRGWEDILAERKLSDPVERRDLLLALEAERVRRGETGPVIAAGSTGSLPAVGDLLAAIARRANGAVVLPGLDQMLDEESFASIEAAGDETETEPSPGHPQFGLKRLLRRIGVAREEVRPLVPSRAPARERYCSEAFRPAATTDRWIGDGDRFDPSALSGIAVIEAADPREETLAVALALREALQTAGARAALVTPDRILARRVAAELTRWGIQVDDSAGIPLPETSAGRFARLVASVAAERFAPVGVIGLLRHPAIDLGTDGGAIDALELAVLRGPRPAPDADGLIRAIEEAQSGKFHRRDPRARLRPRDWAMALDLAQRLGKAFAPLSRLAPAPATLGDLLSAHRAVIDALGARLDASDDGRAVAEAFADLAGLDAGIELRLDQYADAFAELLTDRPPIRPPFDGRARIRILGPLEARLLAVDRVVLGGLNEGVWPPDVRSDVWLNRPLRRQLGLDLPERRIGLSAHDFVQALGAPDVLISRARKQNGVEMVASRFLQRLAAVAPQPAWAQAVERGERYRLLARECERPVAMPAIRRPAPRPPLAARPNRFSVTDIEILVRDPYSIYARDVLALLPLEEIDADPGAAERGTILHDALAWFTAEYPEALPADALDRLLAHGRAAFGRIRDFPGIVAVWWPRFERAAHWFIHMERTRRPSISRVCGELNGRIALDIAGREFTLTARADRIELRADGSVAVVDYKTGEAPSLRQALSGLAPQLPLEAAIVRCGGFAEVPAGTDVAEIAVARVSGGVPPGKWQPFDLAGAVGKAKELVGRFGIADENDMADFSLGRLKELLAKFAEEETPYRSIPRPQWRARFGRYDHLARIKEWSADEEAEE